MLWLYWFGTIFLEYLDQKKLVAVYILGGISGAIVYIISFNVFLL
jgi:membrane associated rhomboid family serine protease